MASNGFPRKTEASPSKSDETIRLNDRTPSAQLHAYPTVLVARDDSGLNGVLVDRLRSENYNVLEADSGDVFDVVRVHSRAIHLLLVDVSMDAHVPILKKHRSELQVVFVKKPVDADEVLTKVRKILGSPPSSS
jgi:CheY-like chemotaxis protein